MMACRWVSNARATNRERDDGAQRNCGELKRAHNSGVATRGERGYEAGNAGHNTDEAGETHCLWVLLFLFLLLFLLFEEKKS
jgi:hypothetical protein